MTNRDLRAACAAAMIAVMPMIGSSAMGKNAVEKTNPEASATDPYWTPERLRAAKPMELPHPDEPAPEAPPSSGETPSVSSPGDPGSGDVPPDDRNLLEPGTGAPEDR